MTTDPIAAARTLLDKVPPLFIDRDNDICRAGDGNNLVGCAATDDEPSLDYLNPAIWFAIPDLRDMVATLADALEAEQAKVAAAYEAAAREVAEWTEETFSTVTSPDEAAEQLRALTTADTQAALNKLLAEARLEGWRAGRDAAVEHCWAKRDLLADAEQKQVAAGLTGRDYYGRRLEAELLSRSIRALPEPKEANHD